MRHRSHFSILLSAICMLLFGSVAFAGGPPKSPPQPPPASAPSSNAEAGAAAGAAALAGAVSGSVSGSSSTSVSGGGKGVGVGIGGDSSARAVAGDSNSSAVTGDSLSTSEANAETGDNTNTIDASTTYARQVPPMIMGTLIPNECGAGAQGGGASTGGAGFLGFTWTTDRCYTLKVANAWAAMGEYNLACEMLADVTRKALKRRGIVGLDCGVIGAQLRAAHTPPPPPAPVVVAPPAPVAASGVTQEEMRAYVDEVFRRAVSK